MADSAAHLVDRVLPRVPVRQWVLTLLFASLRRRARRRSGLSDPRCGAVTFVQRFGDALNLNLHFHTLVLELPTASPARR